MEASPPPATTATTTSSSSSSPAPFLMKTYEMVDDSTTDEIVSWGPTESSFVVWNPPEFQRLLLPSFFKHNNFSSFIRQLNTYGFRKIDPERWEFANEEFVKGKKHLLKNIHRRKPIHSHSNPPVDPERAAFEEEIEKLTREKNELHAKVSGFMQQQSLAKSQLEDVTERLGGMELRQENLLSCLQKAVQNPSFVEHLAQRIEAMDLSAYNKKRRLPRVGHSQPVADINLVDSQNQSSGRPEVASTYQQDLSNKLKLELSTAVSNMNLVSNSTDNSNEECASPPRKSPEADPKDAEMGISTLPFATETVGLSETDTRLAFKIDTSLSDKIGGKECPGLPSLQPSLVPTAEYEGHVCCQLNLSLASSPLQTNQNPYSSGSQGTNRDEIGVVSKNNHMNTSSGTISSSQEAPSNNKGATTTAPARVNDVFWEQFLTERPGSSDTEEASSCYRALSHDEQEEKGSSHGMSRTANNLGKLTL